MVSIRKLEKLLEPFWIEGGASSEFTDYDKYREFCRIPKYSKILRRAL